ncbi:MAG: hypothetical protein FWG01_01385 [Betaproteobacteria bacterium]|nr:hypothetical protein [Betaproteobacteria bacterium]
MMSHKESRLKTGLKGSATLIVSEQHTARNMGSGSRDVLATPMLVALLEAAAQDAIANCLTENQQTVGIHLDLTHHAATPLGVLVTGHAELVSINGRTLIFALKAFDEMEEIASGTHTRTLALTAGLDRLLQKKKEKLKNNKKNIKKIV